MNIVVVVVNAERGLYVSEKHDQRAGLKHRGKFSRGGFPGRVGNDFGLDPAQDRLGADKEIPGGNVVVAGDDDQLLHLGVTR